MARARFARTLRKPGKGARIRFCETNPPFCGPILYTTCYSYESYGENGREFSVGSFWKTNPPGGGNEVIFIEKWVRFRKTKPLPRVWRRAPRAKMS
jgi:hypothetical protein